MLKKSVIPFFLVAAMLVLSFLGPSIRAQSDALSIVQAYQLMHNSEDVDGAMALFTDDAEFEYVGQGTLSDAALRAIHEYNRSLNGRLAFINCAANDQTVTCQTVEFNAWIETAGLQPLFYTSAVFTLENGRIRHMQATMSPESAQAIGETLAAFIPWLMQERPTEAAPLFGPDGAFIYSGPNGELVLKLLREWREATAL